MSHFYLDASAVVKRYSPETGTAWVRALTDPAAGHIIMLGDITLAEVAAAIAAKHRAPGGITVEERDNAVALFLSYCITDYELIAVNRSIIDRAVDLTLNGFAHKVASAQKRGILHKKSYPKSCFCCVVSSGLDRRKVDGSINGPMGLCTKSLRIKA